MVPQPDPQGLMKIGLLVLCVAALGAAAGEETAIDKADLKQEILADLRESLKGTTILSSAARQQLKEEIKQEILQELRDDAVAGRAAVVPERPLSHPQAVHNAEGVGSARGRFLRNGAPLPGCRVKLTKIEHGNRLMTYQVYEGRAFETQTDSDGQYVFTAIPTGDYKLRWELPGDSGWIRRLKEAPDVTVRNGETGTLKDIETVHALVPH